MTDQAMTVQNKEPGSADWFVRATGLLAEAHRRGITAPWCAALADAVAEVRRLRAAHQAPQAARSRPAPPVAEPDSFQLRWLHDDGEAKSAWYNYESREARLSAIRKGYEQGCSAYEARDLYTHPAPSAPAAEQDTRAAEQGAWTCEDCGAINNVRPNNCWKCGEDRPQPPPPQAEE